MVTRNGKVEEDGDELSAKKEGGGVMLLGGLEGVRWRRRENRKMERLGSVTDTVKRIRR